MATQRAAIDGQFQASPNRQGQLDQLPPARRRRPTISATVARHPGGLPRPPSAGLALLRFVRFFFGQLSRPRVSGNTHPAGGDWPRLMFGARRRALSTVDSGMGDETRCSRGDEGSSPQGSFPVVCGCGLLGIEGFAVRVCFEPDRCTQRTVVMAVHRRGRELFLEVLNPLKSGIRLSHTSDGDVALH